MDIVFLITTYNRKESCQRLVDSLQGLGDIVVVGDCVDYTISGATFYNLNQHNGRAGYWRTVKRLFNLRGKHKYFMMIPDDFAICNLQIVKAIELWESIDDPQKICLNLYADRIGLRCWTNFYPVDLGNLWQTGWVDMCFLCDGRFFQSIKLKQKFSSTSSGVGVQISRQLFRKGFHLYQVKESLVTPQPEHNISQMHVTDDKSHSRYRINSSKGKRTWDSRRKSLGSVR